MRKPAFIFLAASAALFAALAVGTNPQAARAASHREAPLISLDPTADITDFFMFRSYQPGNADKVVMIMDVIPGEEPSSGPNYWNFDPNVIYRFSIDNNRDGKADDIEFELQFRNEIRGIPAALGLPLSYVGCGPPTPDQRARRRSRRSPRSTVPAPRASAYASATR